MIRNAIGLPLRYKIKGNKPTLFAYIQDNQEPLTVPALVRGRARTKSSRGNQLQPDSTVGENGLPVLTLVGGAGREYEQQSFHKLVWETIFSFFFSLWISPSLLSLSSPHLCHWALSFSLVPFSCPLVISFYYSSSSPPFLLAHRHSAIGHSMHEAKCTKDVCSPLRRPVTIKTSVINRKTL